MNFCEQYADLIQDLLEDELDEQLAARAEAHVFACRRCREQYETLRSAKEIYSRYLFEPEPPSDSWAKFEARLAAENEKAAGEKVVAANRLRRRRMLGFSLSPASAAFAALLIACGGIAFVLRQSDSVQKDGDNDVAQVETQKSPEISYSQETGRNPAGDRHEKNIGGMSDDVLNYKDSTDGSTRLKARSGFLSGPKSFAGTVRNKPQTASSNPDRKSASQSEPNEESWPADWRAQKLELEIAGQMEKIELLLRSFRNARSNETTAGFDVEYEKRQARKLLDRNAVLKRGAENYGLSYAEELLSLAEPHLLEIANLETEPSTDRVLDIVSRVSSQNIIASLQAYNRDATR